MNGEQRKAKQRERGREQRIERRREKESPHTIFVLLGCVKCCNADEQQEREQQQE